MKLPGNQNFFSDIVTLVKASRNNIAATVNSEITLLYWKIGSKIKQEILNDTRAEYGKQVIEDHSNNLMAEFGLL